MSEWTTVQLSDVADVRVSNVDKKSVPGEPRVLLCNYMDVYANDYITADLAFMEATATTAQVDRFKIEEGDVMITKDSETPDDIGIPAIAVAKVENLVCGYHLALIKPRRDTIDGTYLAKQLGTRETARYFGQRASGSTRYGLSNGAITKTPILLAPLAQQRRIAEILSTVDEAIEQTEALMAKLQQMKAGLMHDLFTRGVTREGHLRPTRAQAPDLYHETPLGWIPKEWTTTPISDVGEIITGNTPSDSFIATGDQGLPFITPGDIGEDVLTKATERSLINRLADRARLIPACSICVVCIGSTIGKLAMTGQESVTNQQINSVVCNDTHLAAFDYFAISHFLPAQLRREAGLQAVPIVNKSTFSRLLTAEPKEPNEAKAVQGRLLAATSTIAAERTHLSKLRQQKQGLMQDLLTGRVRVKVS